jgi:tripartite-type tricarboxylate transporter receptor subunit TctC
MTLYRKLAAIAAGLAFATLAVAQGYPQKPVRIVVAYGPDRAPTWRRGRSPSN